MVGFAHIPNNLRTPLFFIEVDNSMANTATASQRTLIVGQMIASGSATANEPVIVSSVNTAIGLFGAGSMLHGMVDVYLRNDNSAEIYVLPLADDAESMVSATGSLVINTAPTQTGVISLYIAGTRVQLTVRATDSASAIALSLAAKINAKGILPVSAVASDSTVTLTAKNLGGHGNNIDIRLNYLGASGGESTPVGFKMTINKMSGGLSAPILDDGLDNLQDKTFDFIVTPYTDTTSLNSLSDFLSDENGRWSYLEQLYGHAFSCSSGTYGELTAIGEGRNNQHETILGVFDSPTPAYLWSASYVGAIAGSLRNDPGRPLQTLEISGVLAPPLSSRFGQTERNNLLYSGISTFTVMDDNSSQAENVITTYQYNSYGAEDDSYLQVETMFLLMYVMRYMKTQVTSKYGRMKLAADGTRFAPGQNIVTPSIIKAELIAQYEWLEYNGYVQGAAQFAKGLVVEINGSNPNRVDILWDGILINQLRIFAVLNQFRTTASN